MTNEMTDEEAKELYAHFGLAYYSSGVLEHGVANALLMLELLEGRGGANTRNEWENLVDKHYEDSFAKTLGRLTKQLAQHRDRSPGLAEVAEELEKCLAERNFLAHHFWRKYAAHWFNETGRMTMIDRLEEAGRLFEKTDQALEAAMEPFAERYGFTPDLVRHELDLIKRAASTDSACDK